jgi:hypothetical protein
LIRLGNILKAGVEQEAKGRALSLLLLSMDHEETALQARIGLPSTPDSCFPAHCLWRERVGGVAVIVWSVLEALPPHSLASPEGGAPDTRKLVCQWIEKAYKTLAHNPLFSPEELTKAVITCGGIPLLVSCMEHGAAISAASSALAAVVTAGSLGTAFSERDPLRILDLITCADPPVQVSLSLVLLRVISSQAEQVHPLLNHGLISIYTSLVSSSVAALVEISINIIHVALGAVLSGSPSEGDSADLSSRVLRSVVDAGLIASLATVLLKDQQISTPTETDRLKIVLYSMQLLDLLSGYPASRSGILDHDSALLDICEALSDASTTLTDPLNASSSPSLERLAAINLCNSIAMHALRVLINISSSQMVPDKDEFLNKTPFLEPCIRIVALSPSPFSASDKGLVCGPDTTLLSMHLMSMFSRSLSFGEVLERCGGQTVAVLVTLVCDAIAYLSAPLPPQATMSTAVILQQASAAITLLTFILYHTYNATRSLPPELVLRCTPPFHEQARLCEEGDWKIFMHAVSCPPLFRKLSDFLKDPNMSHFACRLLQVLAASPHTEVLSTLWLALQQNFIIERLLSNAESQVLDVNTVEYCLLALGTLAGAPPYFVWECVSLDQNAIIAPRQAALLQAGQERALNRIDRCKIPLAAIVTDADGVELVARLRDQSIESAEQRSKESDLRRKILAKASAVLRPSLTCVRDGIRVVGIAHHSPLTLSAIMMTIPSCSAIGAARLVQALTIESDFNHQTITPCSDIYSFSSHIQVSESILPLSPLKFIIEIAVFRCGVPVMRY